MPSAASQNWGAFVALQVFIDVIEKAGSSAMPCVGMAFRPRYMWYHVWLMISAQRDTLTDSTTHRHFMLTARLPWEFEHQGEHFNVNETGTVEGRCGGLRQEWRSFSEMRALWHFAACPRYLGRSWWIASVSLNSVRKAVVVQSNVFYSSRNKRLSRTPTHWTCHTAGKTNQTKSSI